MSGEASTEARRRPTQQRSKERLERILSATTDLIARKGGDHVKMSEVAALAEISIGSLYQYFPEKSALIRALAERYNAESRRCIEEALAGVADRDGLLAAWADLMDQYLALMRAEPVMRDIWAGAQADHQLAALQLEESRACSALLAAAMARAHPRADRAALERSAFVMWELGEAAVRLAVAAGPGEDKAMVDVYTRLTLRELAEPSA